MAQRYDIIRIDFQANARGANAAIESLRNSADECNARVTKLKQDLKDGIKMGKSTEEIEKIRNAINAAQKESRQFSKAYNELAKGMRTLDTAIKAFNDGSLSQMSQAFQKAANNAAKLTRTKLDPMSDSYNEDYRQLTALMDATQQNYARMQGDAQQMLKTLKDGGKVSVAALQEEIKAQAELLTVLSETDKGYQRTAKNLAVMQQYLRAMGGDYEFVRQNISDTKKVSDDMLRNMYSELQKTNQEGKVTKDIMRENAAAMKEIRAEQARRVENVLGGNLGRQSEGAIRTAIANAKELLLTYKSGSREAMTLSAQIVNAEEHLKTHGIEGARAAAREAAAIKTQEEAEKQLQTTMNKRLTSLKTLSADALAETRKYWEAQRSGAEEGSAAFKKAENALKSISNQERSRKVQSLDAILGDPSKHGIADVRNAVQEMEKLRDSVQKGIPVWQHYNKMVNEGRAYLDNLAKNEAVQRITAQMQNLTRLSAVGLSEVKKYWEAQYAGAERGTKAYQEAEAALKRITNLEKTRQEAQANRVLNNMGSYGDAEIRKAIQAMEQLRDAQAHGSKLWDTYNKRVEEGKRYLEEWANADSIMKMEARMQKLPQLSDAAMAETKKFWETMVAGAEKGSQELREYEAHLERVKQEEGERRQLSNEITVQRLSGNLANLSEKEIREAIEAGKQLIQTYKTASPEAEALAKKIVNAEEHLKQYGLSAEQAARREAAAIAEAAKKRKEADDLMENQLRQGSKLSESALKAQEQYWQRLIDDPKTAAASLQKYQQNLEEVRSLQQYMIRDKGVDAYRFFANGKDVNASADEIKRQADALKKFRDNLPQKDNANLIKEIDTYLARVGETSQKSASQAMSLKDALRIGSAAGGANFKGTVEQLTQAKKTLEELQQKAVKGGYAWRRMQEGIDSINLELRRTSFISKEVQAILDAPKGKSFNELKQAVEQGRAALQNMRRTTEEERKAFDELAKKVKEADAQMKALGSSSKASASSFDKAWSRLKTYVGLYVSAAVAMQKLTGTIGDIMELSDKMGEVRKTTGFTADEVGRLSNELKKMDTRTTLTGLMELSAAAGQLGLNTQEDVQGFTEAANKLMVALPEMGREGATEMLKVALATGEIDKIRKQMEEGIIDGSSATAVAMEKVGSTIDRLRATSASTAPAITDFVKRVGAVGAQSGITIDQVAALGSTVDALGMRVEMSATALSRMMPAIKNNAFDIAKILGVTPNSIRELYDTGRGMEVILMILQHIKDAGMDADSIENMLGMGGMAEVMKELNQQGARAGIVFGGLSQNVDELRRQLGVAQQAYKENVAIQQEYNKMNETTAAKWERLKNQVEEMFVGDRAQRWLGGIIDGLRKLVDIISGNVGPALKLLNMALWSAAASFATFRLGIGELAVKGFGLLTKGLGLLKQGLLGVNAAMIAVTSTQGRAGLMTSMTRAIGVIKMYVAANWTLAFSHDAAAKAAAKQTLASNKLAKSLSALKTNVIMAVVAAIGMLVIKYNELKEEANEAAAETGRFNQKLRDEKKELDSLFSPLNKSNLAQNERSRLISEINSKYGRYLGFMLSETNSAIQLANAHALIAKRIREEAYEKRILDQENKVREKYDEDMNAAYGRLEGAVRKGARPGADIGNITDMLKDYIDKNLDKIQASYNLFGGWSTPGKTGEQLSGMIERFITDNNLYGNSAESIRTAALEYMKVASRQSSEIRHATASTRSDLRNVQREIEGDVNATLNNLVNTIKGFGGTQGAGVLARPSKQGLSRPQWGAGQLDWQGNAGVQADVQMPLPGAMPRVNKKNIEDVKRFVKAQDDLRGYLEANADRISQQTRATAEAYLVSEKEMKELRSLIPKGDVLKGEAQGTGDNNLWGGALEAASTDWKNMTAEQLVARRKQMNEFVNAIQTDTDVKAVLEEDAALKKAIEKGMSSDMRTVIEWYNTERLKIQDELHARHLTNTGDWLDPKKQRARKKQLQDEWSMYLKEIDAYYTERKTRIQEAGTEEGITEAEVRNRTLANEMEWHQRRAELQKMYADKSEEVTADEQKAIYDIISERTGEDTKLVEKTIEKTVDFMKKIGEKSPDELKKALATLGLGWERDFLKQQQAVTQQMKAIQDIIDKERPFNGITKNLRENLVTMGILTADMTKERDELMKKGEDMADFNARQAAEEVKRTAFMLGEAENAYSTTIEEVMRHMAANGMQAWADELKQNPQMRDGLMAQLRSTYDQVQDAIKKEASQLKKQAEIMWNNVLVPGGDGKTTMKQLLDRTVAQLGLAENRVSRANNLIGAGQASDRVADRLAIKQMQVQLAMQEHYYNLMKKQGLARVEMLEAEAAVAKQRGDTEEATRKTLDAQHARMSLNLATAKEETELAKQREDIIARTEESQNRLYTELKSWADLLASSLQSLFEASHAGDKEYYNELAKLELTGKGGPGAGTYIVIENEGTSDAEAHYEYLDEREALDRQREIERQNAQAEAWRKVMDDINMKMSETITDQMNAMLQNASVDANTDAVGANTEAIIRATEALNSQEVGSGVKLDASMTGIEPSSIPEFDETNPDTWPRAMRKRAGLQVDSDPYNNTGGEAENTSVFLDPAGAGNFDSWYEQAAGAAELSAQRQIDASNNVAYAMEQNFHKQVDAATDANRKTQTSTQSMFAKMTQALNLYGVAYQAMSNDNLSTEQKFQMIALQAAGSAAMAALTSNLSESQGNAMASMPGVLGKIMEELGPIAGPIAYAAFTALIGGLMGMAVSKVTKAKSQIASVTGASSVGAGRLSMGMLTYAEGNVNAFTDPSTLTPGKQYNVDAADGKTYRARYMGRRAKTHITNGPEFHLSGEKGREMIIDADTTRQITLNERDIWHTIQTLSAGRRMPRRRLTGRGMPAFADGNVEDFEEMMSGYDVAANGTGGMSAEQSAALQASIDRQSDLLERALTEGIRGVFAVNGPDGLVNTYDKGKRQALRHGQQYP